MSELIAPIVKTTLRKDVIVRNTGLSSSIGLIAVGAILAWAVTFETDGIDINKVGLILFAVGILGVVVTMAMTATSQKTVIERKQEVVVASDQAQQQPLVGQAAVHQQSETVHSGH